MGTSPRNSELNRVKSHSTSQWMPPAPTAPLTPTRSHRWISVPSIALLLSATGLIAAWGWLGVQLMVNPQALVWINRFLPDWIPIPVTGLKPPQTLTQIRQEIQKAGQEFDDFLLLGKNTSFLDTKSAAIDLLLPVLAPQASCPDTCEPKLVELRLYQLTSAQGKTTNREPYYQLVNQLKIVGPEESFAIAPLIDSKSSNQGSSRSLPLTHIARFEGTVPPQGVWLNLTGKLVRGEGTTIYGQVLHYNPARFHLSPLLDWTGTSEQGGVWQEVTGGGLPEFVVNQTVGMEPQFKIYRVQPTRFLPTPIQLEPISLLEPALKSSQYDKSLVLARSGLWSPGWYWLRSLQQKSPTQHWSDLAQAQLDLIHWHAQATQTQADASWSSPSQQVLVNLIDGRWARALQVFMASAESSRETATLLKADAGRLGGRVEAALTVNPAQPEVRTWGALLIAAQRGRSAAIAWLKQQPKTPPADIARIQVLINRLDGSIAEPEPVALPPGYLVGSAQRLASALPNEWFKPQSSLPIKLEEQQQWYLVEVAGFHNGKRWQGINLNQKISSRTVDRLWKQLGLAADPWLQIIVELPNGEQQTIPATITAVRMRSGNLQLLAMGEAIPAANGSRFQPFAYTEAALQWLAPDTLQLADLMQQQPTWASKAIPQLGRELQQSGHLRTDISTWEALNSLNAGSWMVQQVPLTSTSQRDIVLTVYPELLTLSPQSTRTARPRTLIFSAAGNLLYSEFSVEAAQTLLAIADLGDGGLPVLVVGGLDRYTLQRWSPSQKQFKPAF